MKDDVIVALLDPDMIFIRPLTTEIRGLTSKLHNKRVKDEEIVEYVSLGNPVAQMYGLGKMKTINKINSNQ